MSTSHATCPLFVTDLPVILAWSGLHYERSRERVEMLPRTLQRHCSVRHRIIDLRSDLHDLTRADRVVAAVAEQARVLIGAREHKYAAIRQRHGSGVPALVSHVGEKRRVGVILVERIAVGGHLAVGLPAQTRAGGLARYPTIILGVPHMNLETKHGHIHSQSERQTQSSACVDRPTDRRICVSPLLAFLPPLLPPLSCSPTT